MYYRTAIRLLRFELIKAWHSHTIVWASLITIAFASIPVVTSYNGFYSSSIAFPTAATQALLAGFLFFGAVLTGILGALFPYDEFRTGTINLVLTAGTPRWIIALCKIGVLEIWILGICLAELGLVHIGVNA